MTVGVTEAMTVVAVLVSLLALLMTHRLDRRSLRVTTYSGATELTLGIGRLMIEHPEVRPYFDTEQGKDLTPDAPDDHRHRVTACAEYILDVFECIWDHEDEYDAVDRVSWGQYVHDTVEGSPVLRGFYRARAGWYPKLDRLYAEQERTGFLTTGSPTVPARRFALGRLEIHWQTRPAEGPAASEGGGAD